MILGRTLIGAKLILSSFGVRVFMKKKPSQPLTPPLEFDETNAELSSILGGPPSRPIVEKPNFDTLTEKGRRISKHLEEVQEGNARGDRPLTSKEFYDRYKDEPSGWCPDSPAAVDSALRRLGMVPVIRGSKGKGNSNKWWHLMAKKLLIKAKRKKERE